MTHYKTIIKDVLKTWSPIAISVIALCLLTYILTSQNYRTLANDPQIQIAEDISYAIETGTPADAIAPVKGNTDIQKSLAPFVLIYDAEGKQIGSSAIYNGENPQFPKSTLDKIQDTNQVSKVTWEPEKNIRIAAIIKKYSNEKSSGYVIAGRSLREVEARMFENTIIIFIFSIISLIISFLIIFFIKKSDHKKTAHSLEAEV